MTALVTTNNQLPIQEVREIANVIAGSGLFGVKDATQAMALMMIAQAEGRHPATIAQEYDIIQGRPALKSQATLARFQAAGGCIQWNERSDVRCSATFTHPLGGRVEIEWTIERASKAGLTGKDNWRKFTTQMLSARVVAEGVRATFPACLNGLYIAEEVQDMEPRIPDYNVESKKSNKHEEDNKPRNEKKESTDEQKRAAFDNVIKSAVVKIGVERMLEVIEAHGYNDPSEVQVKDFRAIKNAIDEIEKQGTQN